jgi:DNA-binding transcriptional regulator YiaG
MRNNITSMVPSVVPWLGGTSSSDNLIYRSLRVILVAGALSMAGTDSAIAYNKDVPFEATRQTDAGFTTANHQGAPPAAVMELRRLSGMTWEQLATLFGVSRRTLHFWASGKPLNAAHEERLYRVLSAMKQIDRGSAEENRNALFTADREGIALIDLLSAGRYGEVLDRVAGAHWARPVRTPIAPEVRQERMPERPEVLANAVHRPSYRDTGRTRAVKVVRLKNKTQGDNS